jgi:hypothetical protein
MSQRTITGTYSVTIPVSQLSTIFDYNNQTSFGLEFGRIVSPNYVPDPNDLSENNLTWTMVDSTGLVGVQTITIKFILTDGSVLEKRPKNHFVRKEFGSFESIGGRKKQMDQFTIFEKTMALQNMKYFFINYYNNI